MSLLRWKKAYSWLLLAALILPILAACGAATPAPNTAASTAPAPSTAAASVAPSVAASEPAAASPSAAASEAAASPSAAASADTGSTAGDKILRTHTTTAPDVVDPQVSSVTNEISILALNYEGLTKLDENLQAVPAAAKEWEFNEAGDVITFTLQDDLKYSDGSPLTSANFAYAVERNCDPKVAGEYQFVTFEIIGCEDFASALVTDTAAYDAGRAKLLEEGVQTPDEKTLVLSLTKPAPYYTYVAGLWTFYPTKKELVEAGGDNWWKDPKNQIGNGPFQWTQYSEGQLAAFEANENYWAGRPKLDGVEIVYIKDTAVALEAYRSGQLDIMQPDPAAIPSIKEDATLSKELLIYPGASTFAWGFNLNKEPFNDKKVREAFAYAIDRETYCTEIRTDCVPAYNWIPEGVAGHISTDAYKFDPEKAKQALAESSYGGPEKLPEIKLTFNADDPAAQPRIEWVAGQLREHLGIEAVLDAQEGQALNAARKDNATYPQAGLFITNWYQDYPDPQNWISVYWNSESFAKRIGYKSEELDRLADLGDRELDQTKREEYYRQANQILLDDLPAPFVYHLANVFLVKPEVTGYKTTSADSEIPGQWGSLLTIDKQ